MKGVTPRYDSECNGYFCSQENHDKIVREKPQFAEACYFCGRGPCVRHMMTTEPNSKLSAAGDSARTPLCQQHYEEWAAYLGLHELVVGHD
jgi:hypothetical protein